MSACSRSISAALVAMLWLLVAQGTRADALSDLTATLKGLRAETPVKGVLDVTSESVDDGDDPKKPHTGHIQLDISAGDDLAIHMGPALVQAISAEEARNTADPDQKEPTLDLLRSTGPAQIRRMVSQADALLLKLDGATSPAAKPAVLAGVPVIEFSVSLPMRLPKKDSANAKDFQDNLVIWLDAQGMPLQYRETQHMKFCKFFLCLTVDQQDSVTLHVLDGRLLVANKTSEIKQSGLGQGSDTKTTADLRLQ